MKTYGYKTFNVGSANISSSGPSLLKIILGGLALLVLGWIALKFIFPKKEKISSKDKYKKIVS